MLGPSSTSTGTTAATTPGTTGTTGTTARGVSYALDGHDTELKSHVGHRIEVVGTLEHKMPPPSATSTTTAGSAARAMDDQKLKVSSVRMIAAECSAK
jgi:hypothetical protein